MTCTSLFSIIPLLRDYEQQPQMDLFENHNVYIQRKETIVQRYHVSSVVLKNIPACEIKARCNGSRIFQN